MDVSVLLFKIPVSVSYTHLDVYKRQAIAASCLELKDTLRGSPWDWIDWGLTVAGGSISVLSVSYTHLDVYKRQELVQEVLDRVLQSSTGVEDLETVTSLSGVKSLPGEKMCIRDSQQGGRTGL